MVSLRTRLGCIWLLCILPAVWPAPGFADTQSDLRAVRRRMAAHDFDGALQRLEHLRGGELPASQVTYLEAACWLGKALLQDNAATEGIVTQDLISSLAVDFPKILELAPNEPFLKEVQPVITRFVVEQRRDLTTTYRPLGDARGHAQKARELARRSLELAAIGSEQREESAALVGWCELVHYLLVRSAEFSLGKLEQSGRYDSEAIKTVRHFLADPEAAARARVEFERTTVGLLPEAAGAKMPRLPLALADCIGLFCIATNRLQTPQFLTGLIKYTTLPPGGNPGIPLPDQTAVPIVKDPAGVLAAPAAAVTLGTIPEALLLPLYQLAAQLDADGKEPGAHYGLYCVLLLLNEKEARTRLDSWMLRRPGDPALILERARFAVRGEGDAAGALTRLLDAIRQKEFHRPIFVSLPNELHPAWRHSRHLRELGPRIALPYDVLFKLIDGQAAETKKAGRSNLPLLTVRLRLSELLMRSDYLPDVLMGITEAHRSLELLEHKVPAEEQQAQAEVYRRQIQEAARRLPPMPANISVTRGGVQLFNAPFNRIDSMGRPPMIVVSPKRAGYLGGSDAKQ